MDIVSKRTRSYIMSRIRSRGTRPEMQMALVISSISGGRLPVMMHDPRLPGSPDFSIPLFDIAIFVNGCFFHGCRRHYKRPGTSQRFWDAKLKANRLRDGRVTRALQRMGWSVMNVWEHDLRNETGMSRVAGRLKNRLDKRSSTR